LELEAGDWIDIGAPLKDGEAQQYNRDIHPVARSSSYYSFEFAKIPPEESE